MTRRLSILIPTYNNVCVALVKSLQEQASLLSDLSYEILVADDGSTDISTIQENRVINKLENCQYIEREKNVGRAAIRNFLARQAKYEWILFLDSDLHIDNPQFLHNYCTSEGDIVVGGLKIGGDTERWGNNLRYKYEKACEQEHDYQHRIKKGDKEFRTTNFLISKSAITKCPFDENFKHYGYEDVLFGKQLTLQGYHIAHIDNPILLDDYETNHQFVLKTEEACRTLYLFREDLKGYSKLIDYSSRLSKWRFIKPLILMSYPWIGLHIKSHLIGNKPSVFWFNVYKLMYYIHLDA